MISIHALREEGDLNMTMEQLHFMVISIHALREEGDEAKASIEDADEIFQSTPSARRATAHPSVALARLF